MVLTYLSVMVTQEALKAAEEGNLTALQRLDSSVLSEDITDEFGSNCLHYAARQGGVDTLRYLVSEIGFKANKRSDVGATPAHDAAAAGNLQTLQWLLQNTECSVSDQDGVGATVLHLACRYHHSHVTEWLLDQGGCDVAKGTASGGLPLHFAVVGRDYEAVKLLLEEDPMTVNLQINNGATAVYLASQEGSPDLLRTLIQDHCGNIKIKSYDGMSCLHAAAQSGHQECVQILVEEERYNPNERDFDGATPLHYAASQGHAHVIDWLMKIGGARVTLDNLGGSPLHNAAEMNRKQCVSTLINNGCDITITDNNGLTAAELARKCFHEDCATLIENYNAPSQIPTEPDVEYLLSAQSPRINLLRPYVTQFDGCQPPNTPSFPVQEPGPIVETGNKAYLNRQKTSNTTDYTAFNGREIDQIQGQSSLKHKTYSVDSIQAEVDPVEFPVGIPRCVSQDFSVDLQLGGTAAFENSPENSSLSSLSHLDEVIENANKELENNHQVEPVQKLDKPQFLPIKPEVNTYSPDISHHSPSVKPEITPYRNSAFNRGYSYLKSNTAKSVSFMTSVNSEGTANLDVNSNRYRMASENKHRGIDGDDCGEASKTDKEVPHLNGTGETEEDTEGSVQIAYTIGTSDTNIHDGASSICNYHVPLADSKSKMEIGANTNSHLPLLNGNISPSHPGDGDSSPIPYISQSSHKQNSVFNSNLSIEQNEQSDLTYNQTVDTSEVNFNEEGIKSNGFSEISVIQSVAPPLVIAPPPPPPPPPLHPALPVVNTRPALDVEVKLSNETIAPTANEEAKKRSVSLPARPTAVFTAEMMQSKRSTLTPAPVNTTMNSSQSANTDFISELKLATKGPALRKTSKVGDGACKPTMIFSSTSKESSTNKGTSDTKDVKTELVGEWDPKNFIDQVPNKDGLPAWKVHLQAKHIAEKTMKETLENRKVEERENRLKNMPAWKRALVEKKEAEARAAEEKRQEEQQKSKATTKKTLNLNVTPKVKDSNSSLAPWQLELQQKD